MKFLIMCQGVQRRLPGLQIPKQLLEINNEPIIYRTVRLLYNNHCVKLSDIYIVAPNTDLWVTKINELNVNHITLENPGHCILTGIHQTQHIWGETATIILLGDVIWGLRSLDRLIKSNGIHFIGTKRLTTSQGEVFGAKFSGGYKEIIAQTISTRLCFQSPPADYQTGHLRELIWAFNKDFDPQNTNLNPKYYSFVDDLTIDVDIPEDLTFLKRFENHL